MFTRSILTLAAAACLLFSACGINSVSQKEIEAVGPGNVLTYRYRKADKEWFYADKITRIEGDVVYYNPSKSESSKGSDSNLKNFDTTTELFIKKADLLQFAEEQGPERKKIIWIE